MSSGSSSASLDSEVHPFAYEAEPDTEAEPLPDKGPSNVYLPEQSNDTAVTEEPKPKPSFLHKVLTTIRPGYVIDHLDYASFKVAFRTFVQVWITVIICVVPRSSHWVGNAAYLLQIVGFICTSGGGSIALNVKTSFSCFVWCLVAWMYSVINMKINNRLHNFITSEELGAALIAEGTCTAENVTSCMVSQIFTGRYMKTTSSVVSMLTLIAGMVLFGLLETYEHINKLDFIIARITLIINVCYGAFFPIFDPTAIGFVVIKPMGLAFALRMIVSIVIFPTTSSYNYLGGSTKIMMALQGANKKNLLFLKTIRPSKENFVNYQQYSKDITAIRAKIQPLEAAVAPTINQEISYGRFDTGDMLKFRFLFKNLLSISAGYEYFYDLFLERKYWASSSFSKLTRKSTIVSTSDKMANDKLLSAIHDSYTKVGEYENKKRLDLLKNRLNKDMVNKVTINDLDRIADFITTHCISIIEASDEGFLAMVQWLAAANNFRTFTLIPGVAAKHREKQAQCHQTLQEARDLLAQEIAKFTQPDYLEENVRAAAKNEDVLLCLISQMSFFLHIAKNHCNHILAIMDLFLTIDENRPQPQFITYFTSSKSANVHDKGKGIPDFLKSTILKRNADSAPPTHIYQILGNYVYKLYRMLMNEHLWFWMRSGGLVVIAATPYFVRTTSEWYYSNRLVWLVIMCAVSTSEYTGLTIYTFGAKFVYTFFGCLLGMVGWYISTGSGTGNYYGYSVVTAFIYFYLSYYRHFSVHLTMVPAILYSVTTALVLGTSWVDGKYNHLANIGGGFRVAYTRFISVIVGLFIGFFACLIPEPKSSKGAIREILSTVVSEIGTLHCYVSKFGLHRMDEPDFHFAQNGDVIVEKFRYVFAKISSILALMVALEFEIPLYGVWPEAKYTRLKGLVNDITQLYYLLFSIFNNVEDTTTWIPVIFRRMGWTDSTLNADLFAVVHMGADSLRTKRELPKITEGNLSVRHLELLQAQWGITKISLSERFYDEKDLILTNGDNDTSEQYSVDFHRSLMQNLDFKKLFSNDGQHSTVALLLAHIIYERLDQTIISIKGLVGEKYDFDETIFGDEEDENSNLI